MACKWHAKCRIPAGPLMKLLHEVPRAETVVRCYSIIQAVIYPGDEGGYVAECLDLAVVTQGKTLDETVQNLQEAIQLHLGEDSTEST